MNSNNNDDNNINNIIKSDLNLNSDNSSDSDEKYDSIYADPEEAYQVVNLLSQAYNEGNKNINSKTVQNLINLSNLNTINENVIFDNNIINNNSNNNNNNETTYNNDNKYNNSHQNQIKKNNSIQSNNSHYSSSSILSTYANNEVENIESLKRKLSELQKSFDILKEENKKLTNEKYVKDGEISVIRKRIKSIEQENDSLKKTIINKTKSIEEEKLIERKNFKDEINRLQTELQFKKQEIDELGLSRSHDMLIKKEYDTRKNIDTKPSVHEFPSQSLFLNIPDDLKPSIYTNKSKFLKETESSSKKMKNEEGLFNNNINNNSYNDDDNLNVDIETKNSPEKEILDKVITSDISVQTVDEYPNQSRIITPKYQIPIPNSRFLFIQRLYNINIYSKLIKYIRATNIKQNNNNSQNLIHITIKKLLSCINEIIANSSIPIINLISPLEEFIGLSLKNKNLKMSLTGLKLLFNIILNDDEAKEYILQFPIKNKIIENIHLHLKSILNIVNQFNINKNKEYQDLSSKFKKKISNYLFTILQMMSEEYKNSESLSIYKTYIDENLIIELFNTHQRMNITINIIYWFQHIILNNDIVKYFQNKDVLEAVAILLRYLNNNEKKDDMNIQLNLIRLYSLLIVKDIRTINIIAESHIVISNIIYVLQAKLDLLLDEKAIKDNKNMMSIIKEGIKFIHAIFTKSPDVFKILDSDDSVSYIFIRLLSRLIVSKYYEDSWSYFIDDIYDIINDLLESIIIGTPHENILKSLNPEEYEIVEEMKIKKNFGI
ncbi:hypothetical protein BCR32DRAFT_264582 [Anaeromyces robustus]|uniref:Uncharacterized protein n=1 Tax=Anaeromyces robustus TaxID=1754192 RepID=A0A1Y1XNS0_9FUNG|nr:hypothetical protein BCR32DRAFT_264582 [Anaeromyces robustus]|eukprot:ORX86964.1 hypothetical protein BCR32DRAFT_264582 [Anaeromyces robustus]